MLIKNSITELRSLLSLARARARLKCSWQMLLVKATSLSIQNESRYADVTRPDYLLYMRISGFQSLFGVIRRSFTPPYSVWFHWRL